jgi:membrane associated rhomboid family serine protease
MIPIRDHNPTSGPVWVIWAFLIINAWAFTYPLWEAGLWGLERAVLQYGLLPGAWATNPATLVTHAFLHGSWAHLLGNLLFLWVFGDNIEDHLGHLRFLAFYVSGAVVAGLAHVALGGAPDLPLVGASGAISAVMGAYIRVYPSKRIQAVVVPLFVPWLLTRLLLRVRPFFLWTLPAWAYLGYWALIQTWEASVQWGVVQDGGGVAWWAHLGGFAFGLLALPLFARSRKALSQ